MNVMHLISNPVDQDNQVLMLNIDIEKAFDSISHEFLIYKMEKMGIREKTL